MVTAEENEILTRVGPGTLMGNLLRRYWTPAFLSSEVQADGSPIEVRLLGEDLLAFRNTDGKVGLVDKACPHRQASLYYGRNEECGLRCIYHGWKFDVDGNCVDMPSEPRPFADRIKLHSYPVHESGGVIWTYMGPREKMTPFRDFGTENLPEADVFASKRFVDCSFLQSMEGNMDSAHVSFLHQFFAAKDLPDDGTDTPGAVPSNATQWKAWATYGWGRGEVRDEWFGFRSCGRRTTANGNTMAGISCFILPYIVKLGNGTELLANVPIDDHTSFRYSFAIRPRPRNLDATKVDGFRDTPYKSPPTREIIGSGIIERGENTAKFHYRIDRENQKKTTFSGIPDFVSQDLAVTESMGSIVDRTKEHLGQSDLTVQKMRSVLMGAILSLERGEEPPAVSGDHDYTSIRGGRKVLEEGEDPWIIGTLDDPAVQASIAQDLLLRG